ncbi:flagellar biosynthesis anti-sigma factor FlgM [Alkalicoccobacillus murimartini]|uniref:Negative regulator of flagellin synthesis n=1 Tax=Alkalicoccobacillus murimartini TaxID=171685 RepID=A0ABT9YFY6_9BACI|nr:flagellar biosynthesis anti-sigma factor FlgM [Alkalicoccobacillus murimartini]MDQ0206768.1 negative regulator of flagellin synthesis FlgM [Alkalicoccobacillus murimartini]
MKINPYTNVQSTSLRTKSQTIDELVPSKIKKDQIEISTKALDLQLEKQADATRAARVEELKKQVESGEYQVNAKKTAERFYDYWKQ